MDRWIWPGETRSGFVFTHLEPGTKAFNVDLFGGERGSTSFTFFLNVPGFEPDHADVDFEALFDASEVDDLDDSALRLRLSEIGCCTTDASQTEQVQLAAVIPPAAMTKRRLYRPKQECQASVPCR